MASDAAQDEAASAEAAPEPAPTLTLEAAVPPALAPRLARHEALATLRSGRGRGGAEARVWLDTADGTLAGDGLALEERRGARRLLRSLPDPARPWCPATPEEPDGAPAPPGDAVLPVAAFAGRRLALPLGPVQAVLLTGEIRCVASSRPAARLLVSGPAPQAMAVMRRLAEALPLLPPIATLAEEGRALARGEAPRPRLRGAPDLSRADSVEDALARAIGHLLEAALIQLPIALAGERPEGVHQLRVALRRLRSMLRVFRRAVDTDALRGFDAELRAILGALGPARDWDVWLGGIGAALDVAMPGDRRIAQLLGAARHERERAYAMLRAVLDAPGFRTTIWDGIALVRQRRWRDGATVETLDALAGPLDRFAVPLLARRWKRLRRDAKGIERLDAEALHELRLDAKRLRYAAEMFAPLWPGKGTRRFLRRLSALQEVLGLANDAAVARALVAHLAARPALRWAVGAAEGWAAARTGTIRQDVIHAWRRLHAQSPFWPDA